MASSATCSLHLPLLLPFYPPSLPLLPRRTRDEISAMRQQRDPVEHVRKLLLDNNLAEAAELKAIEKVQGL